MGLKASAARVPGLRSAKKTVARAIDARRVRQARSRRPIDPRHRRLNFGGGAWFRPGWEVVDLYAPPWYIDYKLDLRTHPSVPLPDACCDLVFTSHVLEHMEDAAAVRVLGEAFRLLVPGATFRVSVPDAEKALEAYRRGDEDFFDSGGVVCRGDNIEQKMVNFFASYRTTGYSGGPPVAAQVVREHLSGSSPEEFIRWCVDQIPIDAPYKAHVNGYTPAKLESMITGAGFSAVVRSSFGCSSVPELRGSQFDNRPTVSLFVEATK